MFRIKKLVRGETIVEVMVAMAVSSILILSAIQLIGRSYTIVGETNKRIEAMMLAEEGIELVRNWRDTNWLKYSGNRRANWIRVGSRNLNTATYIKPTTVGVEIDNSASGAHDVLMGESDSNGNIESVRLYRNSDEFLVTDSSNNKPSAYYRTIQVTPSEKTTKITVDSEVFWQNPGQEDFETVKISTDLYDFYELN
ncbi:hypothetical protein CSB37_00515 [bacterium DOLZORAL124_38_8]|nr:MAG: hypothetical protein CSB37_00515 [bacterium DOLZORAL124_38_8]